MIYTHFILCPVLAKQDLITFKSKLHVFHSVLVEKIMNSSETNKPRLIDSLAKWAKHLSISPLQPHPSMVEFSDRQDKFSRPGADYRI